MPNASLTEMIDLLARRLKINYILDPAVRGTVSIFTYGEVKPVDLMQLLRHAGFQNVDTSVLDREKEAPHFETVMVIGEKGR